MRHRGMGLVVVALLGALSACGGGADTAAPTPSPEPTYTDEQLAAALPTQDDVPDARSPEPGCPDDPDECSETDGVAWEGTRSFTLAPLDPAAAERDLGGSAPGVVEFADVSVRRFDTADQAAAAAELVRTNNAQNDGTIDTPAESTEEGRYTPGVKGEGSIETVAIEGADGVLAAKTFVLVNPEGEKSRELADAVLTVVVQDTVQVRATVLVYTDDRGDDPAVTLATQLVTEYLERLEAS